MPVLYLRANRDRIVPAANLARVRHVRPDGSVATFDAPHMVLQYRPAETAAAIVGFAGGLREP